MYKKEYRVSKRMEIAGSHMLNLPYESKCANLHGHNWIVTVHCKSNKLTDYGMIIDFAKIKSEIHGFLDHGFINSLIPNMIGLRSSETNTQKSRRLRLPAPPGKFYAYAIIVAEMPVFGRNISVLPGPVRWLC